MEGWLHRGPLWALLIVVLSLAAVVAGCSCEEAVTVPNLVGLEEIEARDALSDAGLELGDVERLTVEADAPEVGTVLSQVPTAGSEVDSGSEVALVVAEGPEKTTGADDGEDPPTAASGGGSGTGTETKPTATATPTPEAEQWQRVRFGDGIGTAGYVGAPIATQSTNLRLIAQLSSESGSFFYLQLRNPTSGETATQFGLHAKSGGANTVHSEDRRLPKAENSIWVQASPDMVWTFELKEYR